MQIRLQGPLGVLVRGPDSVGRVLGLKLGPLLRIGMGETSTRVKQVREGREARRCGPPGEATVQAMVTTTFRLPSPGGGTSAPVVMVPKRLSRIETRRGFEPTTVAWFPSE